MVKLDQLAILCRESGVTAWFSAILRRYNLSLIDHVTGTIALKPGGPDSLQYYRPKSLKYRHCIYRPACNMVASLEVHAGSLHYCISQTYHRYI